MNMRGLAGVQMGKHKTNRVVDRLARTRGTEMSRYRRLAGQGKEERDAKGHASGVIGGDHGEQGELEVELSTASYNT